MKKQRIRGLYAKQITVQREVKTSDGQGGSVSTWVTGQQRRADVEQKTVHRLEQGLQMGDDVHFEIIVDAKGFNLILTDRLIYGSKFLYVQSIENIEQRGIELKIIAIERRTQ